LKAKAGKEQDSKKADASPPAKSTEESSVEASSYAVDLNSRGVSVSLRMREIVKLFGRQLSVDLNAHGITLGQWRFLRVLWERDGRSQKDIAEALAFTPGATVFALTILERDNLAVRQRSTEDSRVSLVYLTPKGRALEKQLLPYAHNSQLQALDNFGTAEIDTLLAFLDRIESNLRRTLEKQSSKDASADKSRSKRRLAQASAEEPSEL
jgi:MarR family transcriptional regulator, organic hydroperoxide resistance regulator